MAILEISKAIMEKKQVFGWANVAADWEGEEIEDLQGDIICPEELERAVYEYVLDYGYMGEQHDPRLRQCGRLIESVVFTKEKMEAMGLPLGSVPCGWWVGFQVTDERAWKRLMNGEYFMFSIEGEAGFAKSYAECLR